MFLILAGKWITVDILNGVMKLEFIIVLNSYDNKTLESIELYKNN